MLERFSPHMWSPRMAPATSASHFCPCAGKGTLCAGRNPSGGGQQLSRQQGLWVCRREGWGERQIPFHSSVEAPSTHQQLLMQTHSATLEFEDFASRGAAVTDSLRSDAGPASGAGDAGPASGAGDAGPASGVS